MIEDYKEYKKIIENHLLDYMPNVEAMASSVYDAMKYSLTAGGKRLRAVLLLASCEFAGGSYKEALPYACAIEYIHTYSLIHDDLPAMDDDDLRRGKPTSHKMFGEAMAILAGDGLLNSAFELMYKDIFLYFDDKEKVKRLVSAGHAIAKGAGISGMIAGQVCDMESENRESSTAMLEFIHMNKTAALIKSAVEAGLYIGGAEADMMRNMDIYAENLGLAFQTADDILDVKGTRETLGKTPGKDMRQEKLTSVSLFGMEEAERRLHVYTEKAAEAISEYYDNAEFFRDLVIELENRTK